MDKIKETKELTFHEDTVTPYFCKDKDEFYKLFYSDLLFVTKGRIDEKTMQHACVLFTDLFHEYFALVINNKIKPFNHEVTEEDKKKMKETIQIMSLLFAKVGVPMKEDEHGNMVVDFDKIEKELH